MSDFRHLFGGMAGGLTLLAVYIIGWGILQRCAGDEYPNPQRVVIGNLQEPYIPQSGDKVLVGDFSYILLSVHDWERLTNAVARLEAVAERRWVNEHKTDAGRRAWHGSPTNRVVSADGRCVTWFYADGFTYAEEAAPGRRASPAVERARKAATRPQGASVVKPSGNIPPRLRAKQAAIAARPAAKEVNATFGPGGKVLKVEEAK